MPGSVYAKVYELVQKVPRGRVITYGLISDMLGGRLSAQGVGWAMRALPDSQKKPKPKYHCKNVPWHRVINARGGISTHKVGDIPPGLQRAMLEAEGVKFTADDTVDLAKYLQC